MSLERVEEPLSNKRLLKSPASSKQSETTKSSTSTMQNGRSMAIDSEPTLIEVKQMRFLIMDAPRQSSLHQYIKKMRKYQVTDVVRVCEPTYHGQELCNAGIELHEMEYKDGTSPSKEIIDAWLELVEKTFYKNPSSSGENSSCIAVHCVAGLGRAPQMVAIALIEFANMDPVEAVAFIRARRRGAINEKQLLYLESYKKQYRGAGRDAACCVIL